MEAVRESSKPARVTPSVQREEGGEIERSVAATERLLAAAPQPPLTEPTGGSNRDASETSSLALVQVVGEEGWEALEALKDVSLQALSILVRRLVDDAAGSASHASGSSRTTSESNTTEINAEQRKELERLINNLRQDKVDQVVSILSKHRVTPRASDSSKIDIDFENLSRSTMLDLYACVTETKSPTPRSASTTNSSLGMIKSASVASSRPRATSVGNSSVSSKNRMSWHDMLRESATSDSLRNLLESAESIPDGGQVAAALTQPFGDRSKSAELLRSVGQSSNSLCSQSSSAPLISPGQNAAEGSPAISNAFLANSVGGGAEPGPIAEEMMTDHGLALALAALCNGLYQIFEASAESHERFLSTGPGLAGAAASGQPSSALYTQIAQRLSVVQDQRTNRDTGVLDPGQQALWVETDRLMALVRTICAVRQGPGSEPPSYEETLELAPRSSQVKIGEKKSGPVPRSAANDELSNVLHAIDRVVKFAPRMDNQSVQLNDRQQKIMSGAALTALVERLNRGKENFESQRAAPLATHRYAALEQLVNQITVAGERRMANQRVALSGNQQHRMEAGKMGALLDRQEKARYKNQDSTTREQRLLADLASLRGGLTKESPQYQAQRYEVSPSKQRNMFISTLSARVDRLSERRFSNQDALSPAQKKEESWGELESILDRVGSGLPAQRASLSVAPAKTRTSITLK
ncbi:hypothetical protein DFJ77DRAFT_442138 [Powellomyces hirtus]|nr:hypothetical protein DFJ77DRAFT_442138 [Powellomyces hirtus]